MLTLERSDDILKILQRDKKATVGSLAAALYVSEATIRRDLDRMEALGLVRRCFGGVMLCDNGQDEPSAQLRHTINLKEKRRIAELTRGLLESDKTLFFDGSTTAGMLAPLMGTLNRVTVVTNGLTNAARLAENRGLSVVIAGGTVACGSDAALGAQTASFFRRLRADALVFSCNALDAQAGATDTTVEQSTVKRLMMEGAKTKILLVDSTKFGRSAPVVTARLSEIDVLVTDKKPDSAFLAAAEAACCRVVFP